LPNPEKITLPVRVLPITRSEHCWIRTISPFPYNCCRWFWNRYFRISSRFSAVCSKIYEMGTKNQYI